MKKWQVGVIVLTAVIVGLSIGIGASYLIVNNTKKEEPKIITAKQADQPTNQPTINTVPAATSVTNSRLVVTQDSTSSTVTPEEKWTGEITLAPKNKNLVKSFDSYRPCLQLGGDENTKPVDCSIKGLSFFSKRGTNFDESVMQINNFNLEVLNQKMYGKESTYKDYFLEFFNNSEQYVHNLEYNYNAKFTKNFDIYQSYCSKIFYTPCGDGGGPKNIMPISKVNYPGTDSAFSSLYETFNDNGNLFVVILAKKGNNIIQIYNKNFINFSPLLDSITKVCKDKFPPSQKESELLSNIISKIELSPQDSRTFYELNQQTIGNQINCRYENIRTNPEIIKYQTETSQELLTTFAL